MARAYDAVIVGGGPGGLSVARRSRASELVVLEASGRLGWPPHCTGIVSPATAEGLTPHWREAVEAVYDAAVFLDAGLRERCRLEARGLAVKLRRPGLEELMAAEAEARGVRVVRGARVVAVERRGGRWRLLTAGGAGYEAGRLLAATGFSHPPAGLPLPRGWRGCERFYGLEARVRLSSRIPGDVFLTVHGTPLAPGFFAWIAPVGDGREAVLGLAAPRARGLWERLQGLVRLSRRLGAEASGVLEVRGGVIARGPPAPEPLGRGGALAWTGDLLCASKPYTGGGLYAIALLSGPLAAWLDGGDGRGVLEAWRGLRRELLVQRAAARVANRFPGLMLRLLARACSRAARGRCRIDFDRHSSLLRCILPP